MPFAVFLKQSDAAPFSYFILRRNGLDPHPTQFANFYGKGATGLRIFLTEIMTAPPPGAADQPIAYVVGLPSIGMPSLPSTCR